MTHTHAEQNADTCKIRKKIVSIPTNVKNLGDPRDRIKKTLVSYLKALRKTTINLRDNEELDRNAWVKYKATWGRILSRQLKARKRFHLRVLC